MGKKRVEDAWELIQHAQCLFLKWNTDGMITFVNHYAMEFFQWEQEVVGRSLLGTVFPDTEEGSRELHTLIESVRDKGRSVTRTLKIASGSVQGEDEERWIFWTSKLLPKRGDGPMETLSTGHDVTEARKQNEELRQSETKYRQIISTTSEGFVLLDKEMCILDANEIMARNLGYTLEEVLGTTPDNFFTKETLTLYLARAERLNSEDHLQFEAELIAKDGSEIPHLVTLSVLRDDNGGITGYVSFLANLTELRVAQQECFRAERNYRRLYENATQGIFQCTLNGRIISANPALARMMGFSSSEEIFASNELPELFYFCPEDRTRLIEELTSQGILVNYELKVRRKDGIPIWVLLNLRLTVDEEGETLIEGIVVDNTARKLVEEELRRSEETFRYLAQHDNLTGLFNTRFLYQRLNEMISGGKEMPFSVVFMDMDNFKAVVDRFGHLNGSRALQEVAQTIRACLEEPCFGVAYGGDEFVLVLPGFSKDQGLQKAEQIRASMRETPYLTSKGRDLSLTASFGVSAYPDDAADITELLGRADRAMFRIKAEGKNGVLGSD
jgi:diguanylate cyclase (GGDEF)-like protein/PAS domain S-box-containing protein